MVKKNVFKAISSDVVNTFNACCMTRYSVARVGIRVHVHKGCITIGETGAAVMQLVMGWIAIIPGILLVALVDIQKVVLDD
jgi:hypothetical protein